MRVLLLLVLVLVAAIALFAATRAIERRSRRPGTGMGIGTGVMLVGSLASATDGNWLLAGLLAGEGLIFAYEAWHRHRDATRVANGAIRRTR